ncbi:hypothetical protein [Chitinivorax sp. B]|uniref:hypothetical protein n=1 Tax=Chitinivorax sp. B TaxID=2502235 RepID=UPI0010F455B8|nr:hypothetical protein [Chitinivorax sp. B]
MIIKFTCISGEELGHKLGDAVTLIESVLQAFFKDKKYGADIDQVTLVAIAVDSDPVENEKFYKPNNKVGRYKDWICGETVKYISLALSFDPIVFNGLEETHMIRVICRYLLEKVNKLDVKIPKEFDCHAFTEDMRLAVEIYLKSLDS